MSTRENDMSQKNHPHGQLGLFEKGPSHEQNLTSAPLAYRLRPQDISQYVGWDSLLAQYPFLKAKRLPGIILFGPPGSGKTALAHLLAKNAGLELTVFNAVLAGVPELKKVIARILEVSATMGKHSVLFIDEIHRFNKAQQDALLPYVERGDFTFVGATTENPKSSIGRALLSRVHLVQLEPHNEKSLMAILERALTVLEMDIPQDILHFICDKLGNDSRKALNALEMCSEEWAQGHCDVATLKKNILLNARDFDRNQDRHYDVASAFIKSLRGSQPDAALLWLAVMLDGGEDAAFIARRLVIFASEDIGNADPGALTLAVAAMQAVQSIGMPEARIILAQAVTYLASTVKSNASYMAINQALEFVASSSTPIVPDHLKNYPPKGSRPYQYPHSHPGHFIRQEYTSGEAPRFYFPTLQGREKFLKERLEQLWGNANNNEIKN